MNNKENKVILREIISYNERQLLKVGGDQTYADDLITLESNGQEVYDFFLDETMRETVEPFEYYGKDKIKDVINTWMTI